MLATKMQRLSMSSAARKGLANALKKSSAPSVQTFLLQPSHGFATQSSNDNHDKKSQQIIRDHVQKFSTMPMPDVNEPGVMEQQLKVLDMNTVRKIKAELMEIDANSDGR